MYDYVNDELDLATKALNIPLMTGAGYLNGILIGEGMGFDPESQRRLGRWSGLNQGLTATSNFIQTIRERNEQQKRLSEKMAEGYMNLPYDRYAYNQYLGDASQPNMFAEGGPVTPERPSVERDQAYFNTLVDWINNNNGSFQGLTSDQIKWYRNNYERYAGRLLQPDEPTNPLGDTVPTVYTTPVNDRQRAYLRRREQMTEQGILPELQSAYVEGKSERAFRNIRPEGYGDLGHTMDRIRAYRNDTGRDPEIERDYPLPRRDDAFRLYLGLPQENDSFEPSPYRPSVSQDSSAVYLRPKYWSRGYQTRLLNEVMSRLTREQLQQIESDEDYERIKLLYNERSPYNFQYDRENDRMTGESGFTFDDNPLGDFTINIARDDQGRNYLSIYDKWDLQPFQISEGSSRNTAANAVMNFVQSQGYNVDNNTEVSSMFGAGKPFELYDRIYFERNYDPVQDKTITQLLAEDDIPEMKKGGIYIKPENRGKFTTKAKRAGMGVQEYARKVLSNKDNYPAETVKQANFARNAKKWKKSKGGEILSYMRDCVDGKMACGGKKKHENGGEVSIYDMEEPVVFDSTTPVSTGNYSVGTSDGVAQRRNMLGNTSNAPQGGTIAVSHNNPGNIKYGNYAADFGAVPGRPATDGGVFAVFPDINTGLEAQRNLLRGRNYRGLTVDAAMRRWSNNGYGGEIFPEIANKPMSELTDAELSELQKRQIRREDNAMFDLIYNS